MSKKSRAAGMIFTLLLIEFIDELIGGVRVAAWPLVRHDFALTYTEIGLLLSLPRIASSLVSPLIGILGDTWKRVVLILGGGGAYVFACFLSAVSPSAGWLLAAYVLSDPAASVFVNLSQAVLMDLAPERHEINMSRWAFIGSLGIIVGAPLVAGAVMLGVSWRVLFGFTGLVLLIALLFSGSAFRREPSLQLATTGDSNRSFRSSFWLGLRGALVALRRKEVLRWLVLLEFAEFMLSILYGFLMLYLVDVAGLPTELALIGLAAWTWVGMLGDFLLIQLLERVPGVVYLRISAFLELALFVLFLLLEDVALKFIALALLGFFNSGWYSILKGRLYSAMPGQSGTVTTVKSLFGLLGRLIPLGMGLAAEQFGLGSAMWLLLLGPLALIIGLPGKSSQDPVEE